MKNQKHQTYKTQSSIANSEKKTESNPSFQMPSQVAQPKRDASFVNPSITQNEGSGVVQKVGDASYYVYQPTAWTSKNSLPNLKNLEKLAPIWKKRSISSLGLAKQLEPTAYLKVKNILQYFVDQEFPFVSESEDFKSIDQWLLTEKNPEILKNSALNLGKMNQAITEWSDELKQILVPEEANKACQMINGLGTKIEGLKGKVMQKVSKAGKKKIKEELEGVKDKDFDADYLNHKSYVDQVVSKCSTNKLVSAETFAEMIEATGSGNAQKRIIKYLTWFENTYPSVIDGNSGKNPFAKNGEDYEKLVQMFEKSAVMVASAGAWFSERGDDPDRAKRAYGMTKFMLIVDNFKKSISQRMDSSGSKAGKTEQEILDQKNEDNFSDKEKRAIGKVKKHYGTRSAKAVLGSLVKPLNVLTPLAGTEGSFSFEVKVPISQYPIFMNFSVELEAERGEENYKIECNSNIKIIGELDLLGLIKLNAGFSLGFFVEAQAKDAAETMRLISYGIYRKLKSNKTIGHLADIAWGGTFQAEKFASKTEEEILDSSTVDAEDDDAPFVQFGWQAGYEDEVSIGSDENYWKEQDSRSRKYGTRYDKETSADPNKMGKEKIDSKRELVSEFAIGDWGIEGNYTQEIDNIAQETEHSLAFSASVSRKTILNFISGMIGGIGSFLQKVDTSKSKLKNLWEMLTSGLEGALENIKEEENNEGESSFKKETEDSLELGFECNLTKGEAELSLSYKVGVELKIAILGEVEIKGETSKKLISLSRKGGKWSLE